MNHSELCHLWAHAEPGKSRKCGSMRFDGDTLYSYATPIARIYRKKRGALVLLSDHNYSATTAKHITYAFRAVLHLTAFRAPHYAFSAYAFGAYAGGRYRGTTDPKRAHAENLAYFAKCAADELASAKRVLQVRGVERRASQAKIYLARWQAYADFFGIRRKCPPFPAAEWEAARARASRIENPDPVRDAKRLKAREQRGAMAEAAAEYRAEMLRSMRAARGENWYPSYRVERNDRWPQFLARHIGEREPWYHDMARRTDWRFGAPSYVRSDPIMLRIAGDEIETSAGAKIPLSHAPRIWRLVEACRATGREYIKNGHTEHAGPYPIDRVESDGTLHAGCHVIPHSELRAMARALGLGGRP